MKEPKSNQDLSLGERIADKVAQFGGSWKFILTFFAVLSGWIITNTIIFVHHPFDPYPFILLNLILSCVAAIQAPVIMMSQNRQEAKDRIRSENDYEVDVDSNKEIKAIHKKVDEILERVIKN